MLVKAAKSNMRPKYCLLYFEKALGEAFHKAVPDFLILYDLFHFIQANVKKIGQLGMKLDASDVVADFNALWYKPTKKQFDMHLEEFICHWKIKS
jgi:hypothetical protein